MRKGFTVLWILCAAIMAVSCGKTKSYTDMLNDEKKAINRLIDERGLEILSEFPKDSIFKENQYVKLKSGLYLNIIDKGTDQRAVLYSTKVYYRCNMHFFLDTDTVMGNYGPHSNGTNMFPIGSPSGFVESVPFTYGEGSSADATSYSYMYVSDGLNEALQYVGDRGKVSLIVPFSIGSYYDQSQGNPIHYEILEYIFEENL